MVEQTPKNPKIVIGLVGGIGSGKSAVARIFESLGAAVIDSDRLAHEVLTEPDVASELRAWWGSRVLDSDGNLNRRAIGEVVFGDPAELAKLEGLLWPRIDQLRQTRMAAIEADSLVSAVVWDAPKLIEAGLHRLCDAVVFVETDAQIRQERLKSSRGWAETELRHREARQIPLDMKRSVADYIVTNNADMDQLRREVEQVFSRILNSRKS